MEEQYVNNGPCACMGRQGDDPFCPCVMRQKGLEPTDPWTPEKVEELNKALKEMFGWVD